MMSPRKQDQPAGGSSRPYVLIVDDEADLCRILQLSFDQEGHETRAAADGAEALQVARARVPAALVLDIKMPGMNGYQMLAQWQQDERLAAVPVLVLTSLTAEEERTDEEWAEKLNVRRFISKPAEPDTVVAAVRELLTPSTE